MGYENILLERAGAVAFVTVNRPKVMNALNAQTLRELGAAFDEVEADAAVRGLVITGAGEKAFVAGADINELARMQPLQAKDLAFSGQQVFAPEALREGTLKLVETILTRGPVAVRLALETIRRGMNMSQSEGEIIESDMFALAATTSDMREGMAAFLEKRKPAFQGR